MNVILVVAVVAALAGSATSFRQVCFPLVGCFNNSHPFDNAQGDLPLDPKVLKTRFHLYTRQTGSSYEKLSYEDPESVSKSSFDPARKTKVAIHGFTGNVQSPYILDIKDALLRHGDYNVIILGWGNGAALPNYNQATANVRLVAQQGKLLLDQLVKVGLDLGDVHLIGHSLGAHLSGMIAADTGNKIGRISGLDPAQPNFENMPEEVRLDAKDAIFVDVLHTDSARFSFSNGGYGSKQVAGDVDVFLNGGTMQPGCPDTSDGVWSIITGGKGRGQTYGDTVACSHNRAVHVYAETINAPCSFKAYPCASFDKFESGACMSCEGGCSSVGFMADQFPGRGVFYSNTLSSEPFCGESYTLQLTPLAKQSSNNHGTIYMSLEGEDGTSNFTQITPIKQPLPTSEPFQHIAVFEEVGTPVAVNVKFVKSDKWFAKALNKYSISEVLLKDPNSNAEYRTCSPTLELHSGKAKRIELQPECIVIG